jgi:predicted O-methyltransferase YrrM
MRTEHSKQGLRDMVNFIGKTNDLSKMTMVEIGTYRGDSTIIFAKAFRNVITIDPFKSGIGGINNSVDMNIVYRQYLNNVKGFKNIRLIKDFSYNVVKTFEDGEIDVVYVDGLHTYKAVKQDTKEWVPKIKKGGYITGHDYHLKKFPGVVKAVIECLGKVKTFKDTSWLSKI